MSFALLEAAAILGVLLPEIRLSRGSERAPDLKFRITLRPGAGLPMTIHRRA
jgi:cytochrome P450